MFKTTEAATPEEYIDRLEEPRRTDVQAIHDLIRSVAVGLDARIESGMLAYGSYHYRYASGREGDWFPLALASNKRYISLYVAAADGKHGYLAESYRDRLPKADIGRSCVRIKRLADIDLSVLAELIRAEPSSRPSRPESGRFVRKRVE